MTLPHADGLAGVSAIWIREIRGRMRGKRAFVFLTFYLAVLGGLVWIALTGVTSRPFGALESVSIGRGIFAAIVLIETLLVLILAPAYTAASISQEREKQTFDLLATSPVSSLAIVVGKLLSAMSFLAIVVGASIPLASLAFLFGGVGVGDLLLAYLVIGAVGVGAGAVGIACSAVFRRTQPATVAAFIAVALAAGGSSLVWVGIETRARDDRGDNIPQAPPPEALLYPNPFIAQGDVLCTAIGGGCFVIPTRPQLTSQAVPIGPNGVPLAPDLAVPPPPVPQTRAGTVWPKSVLAWLIVAIVAILVAAQTVSPTRRLRAPPLRRRVRPPIATTNP